MKHFQDVNDWWNATGEMRALFEYNILRVDFIKEILSQNSEIKNQATYDPYKPLKGMRVLDAGCGGGLLSESLARLGASVVGVDASENSIKVAEGHKQKDWKNLQNLEYRKITIEELLENEGKASFDMVTSMEVIEHVSQKQVFLNCLGEMLKPNGFIFMSTMSKTPTSYLQLIMIAEYVLRLVKVGTHDWEKFINPQDLSRILAVTGVNQVKVQGVRYDFFNNQMVYTDCQDMYLYAGRKQ